jgi:hypothetical protein
MIFVSKYKEGDLKTVLGFDVHVTLEHQTKHGWVLRIESETEDLELILRGNIHLLRHAIAKEDASDAVDRVKKDAG